MSEPLLPAERAQYSALIDGILANGDLQTVTAKQIRKGLESKLNHDIDDKKDAVKALILERFDHFTNAAASPPTNGHIKSGKRSPSPTPVKTSPSHSASDSEATPPPKKTRKAEPVDDAKLAALLQAQENGRSRSTRGGGTAKKVTKKAKKPRKKSEKKVKAEDESEPEVGTDGEVREKAKKGGFHKKYHLSAPLAELVGEAALSRPQVVKKIWEYIKERDLQDPADKRQIRCDERLQAVFKQDKVHMFTMNKLLGKQLYDVEEE